MCPQPFRVLAISSCISLHTSFWELWRAAPSRSAQTAAVQRPHRDIGGTIVAGRAQRFAAHQDLDVYWAIPGCCQFAYHPLHEFRHGVPVARLLPGAGLDDLLLVASSEVNTDDDRAALVAALKEALS